jgi:hypothetical protein
MAKELSISKVITRQAAKPYNCQCLNADCPEKIEKGQEYALFKIMERLQGSIKTKEKKVSMNCEWFKKWREFLNI